MALKPRDHVLLLLKTGNGGDKFWRHGVILDEASGVHHQVLTGSRVVREIDFSNKGVSKIVPFDGETLPRQIKRKDAYLDIDSPKGMFSHEEIEKAIESVGGARLALPAPPVKGILKVRADAAPARRVRGKSPHSDSSIDKKPGGDHGSPRRGESEPRPAGYVGEPKDGEGWYVLLGSPTAPSGVAVCLAGRRAQVLGDLAVYVQGANTLVAFWATAEEATEKLRKLRIRCSGLKEEDFEGIDDVFNSKAGTPRGDSGGGAPAKACTQPHVEDDPRVLMCHFESDGRRFRKLAECEPEWQLESFDDWPLQGERNLPYSCRQLRREERTWLGHHDNWVKLSGVRNNDRSVHEHLVLCTSLHHLVTYDQLQLVNLAGAEAINVRRQLIERAHEGHPEAPRWDAAEDFLGYNNNPSGTLVDPQRIAYVASKQSQKAKILEATVKAQEARAAWLRRGKGDGPEGSGDASGSGEQGGGGRRAPPPNKG